MRFESEGPTLESRPTASTGVPAAVNSLLVSLRQLGVGRTYETWRQVNKTDGFDCPGCAWAVPDGKPHAVEFCENGAKAFADDASTRLCGPEVFASHSVAELAAHSDLWLNTQGRISQPMFLPAGEDHYRPIAWDDAFRRVADELRACNTPDEAVFYTSGKAINESAFLFQLLARRFGTNNLPDCSNMCHESSGLALIEALGAGKATVSATGTRSLTGSNGSLG